ncbi:MAG: hypothetical protein U1E17_06195 [Geminicoccaceae bacterium]
MATSTGAASPSRRAVDLAGAVERRRSRRTKRPGTIASGRLRASSARIAVLGRRLRACGEIGQQLQLAAHRPGQHQRLADAGDALESRSISASSMRTPRTFTWKRPAEIIEAAVRTAAHEIAGAVEPAPDRRDRARSAWR